MKNFSVIILGVLALQAGLRNEGFAQGIDPETRAVMATAIRAILIPSIPGRVLVSTKVNAVVADDAAMALARELGATAIARPAAFVCAKDPKTQKVNKRTCSVDGGQLVEVRAMERSGSSAQAIVRIYTNEGGHSPTAREFRVDLERAAGSAWRVCNKVLLEIT